MKKFLMVLCTAMLIFGMVGSAGAALINPVSVTGTGSYHHSADLLIDGFIPGEMTWWQASTNVWWVGSDPAFTIDLGALYTVEDVVLQVDNNDNYHVSLSTNGTLWAYPV
jgi:hypothetical protein